MPRSSRSAKQKSRRAAEDRDRRAAETPPSRQVRLDSDKASTRRRRQAQTLESSITAKRRNSRMRAELRRQATDVAAARCARRDATHSDAFEQRFLLRASDLLRKTHLIVRKLKVQSMEWRGASPLSMPDPLTEQKMQTCKPNGENTQCLCITIHWDFESPIVDATNEKESCWL